MTNIMNQRGSITIDPTDIKNMIWKYSRQNCAHKFYNLGKWTDLRLHLPKLIQENIVNPNKKLSSQLKTFPQRKFHAHDSMREFYQTFKKEKILTLHRCFPKIE